MVETLEKDGYRIDRASQVMLQALNGDDEWVRGQTLREAADLAQNGQVFYRMEEHLMPAGLAQEAARTERNGHVEPRQFRLTSEGVEWVTEHADALVIPTTREEAAAKAGAAYEAAESARSSVQNYRKKLYRVKGRVEELEELPERVRETETRLTYQAESLDEIRSQVTEVEEAHAEFVGEMREVAEYQHEEVPALVEENVALEERVEQLEWKVKGMARQQAEQTRRERNRWKVRDGLAPFAAIVLIVLSLYGAYMYLTFTGQLLPILVSGFVGGGLWFLAAFLFRDWLFPRRWVR